MALEIPLPPPTWVRPLPPAVERDGMRSYLDVPVWEIPGYRPLCIDVHLPSRAGRPAPLILYIHGGAWLFGSRSVFSPVYLGLADPFGEMVSAGFAVASVEYRLSGEAAWPASLHDVVAGLRYVVARADELHIDVSRTAVWGESAGGHLAMSLVFRQHDPVAMGDAGPPVALPPIAALVDWYGVSDIRVPMGAWPLPGPTPEQMLIGGENPATHHLGHDASPIAHVSRPVPAALIMHGRDDSLVPHEGSLNVATALRECGTPVTEVIIDGAEHGWAGTPDIARQALTDTINWLRETLRP